MVMVLSVVSTGCAVGNAAALYAWTEYPVIEVSVETHFRVTAAWPAVPVGAASAAGGCTVDGAGL